LVSIEKIGAEGGKKGGVHFTHLKDIVRLKFEDLEVLYKEFELFFS